MMLFLNKKICKTFNQDQRITLKTDIFEFVDVRIGEQSQFFYKNAEAKEDHMVKMEWMIFSGKSTLKFVQEYKGKTVLLATCEAWSKNKKLKKGA